MWCLILCFVLSCVSVLTAQVTFEGLMIITVTYRPIWYAWLLITLVNALWFIAMLHLRLLGHPTVGCGLRFYCDSFYLSSFSSHTLRSRGTEVNENMSEVSVIWKCMSKLGLSHPATNRGPKKPPFSRTSQLDVNFNGLCLPERNMLYIIMQVRWQLEGDLLPFQNHINFGLQKA